MSDPDPTPHSDAYRGERRDAPKEPTDATVYTKQQLERMHFELLKVAIIGLAQRAGEKMWPKLTAAQQEKPDLAAAIMADKIARNALYVFNTPAKSRGAKDSNGKAASSW